MVRRWAATRPRPTVIGVGKAWHLANYYESHDIVMISISSVWGSTSRALRTTGYVVYMPADGVIDEIDTLPDSDWARDSASRKSVSSGIVHWQVSNHAQHHVRAGLRADFQGEQRGEPC